MFNIEEDKFKDSVEVIIDDLTFDYVEVHNTEKNQKKILQLIHLFYLKKEYIH